MTTITLNTIQFYNPSFITPSPSARHATKLQKHRQPTRIPHRKEQSCVLESHNLPQQIRIATTCNQDDPASNDSTTADEDDNFPPLQEILRPNPHLKDSAEKPTNFAPMAQEGINKTSFLESSRSSMPAQSSLHSYPNGSKERPVVLNDNDDDDSDEHEAASDDVNTTSTERDASPSSTFPDQDPAFELSRPTDPSSPGPWYDIDAGCYIDGDGRGESRENTPELDMDILLAFEDQEFLLSTTTPSSPHPHCQPTKLSQSQIDQEYDQSGSNRNGLEELRYDFPPRSRYQEAEPLCRQQRLEAVDAIGEIEDDEGSKEQPVILDDDNDDDNSDDDTEDNSEDSNNHEDTVSSSSRDISGNSKADDTSQELGPPPSPTTSYPSSRPSSSCSPSLHPSTVLHSPPLKDQAIQQDDGYISREMLEEPGCATPILSGDTDDETEIEQQQEEAVEGREKEARNSDMTSCGDIDNDDNYLQDNNKNKVVPLAKQCQTSPSCDLAISCKRRLQQLDEGISTMQPMQPMQQQFQEKYQEKEQEHHDSDNVSSSRSGSDRGYRGDQVSNNSECPRPTKRRRPSPSSSDSIPRHPPQQPCDSNPTSKHTCKHRFQRSHKHQSVPPQTQLKEPSSILPSNFLQSNITTLISAGEHESTSNISAEYREWPIRGVLKRVIVGGEVQYGMDFSLEALHITYPQHTVAHQSADKVDPKPGDSWDIHKITGMRNIDGVEEFRVAWAQTWIPQSDLGGAGELVDKFKGKLSVQQRHKMGQGKTDVAAESLLKRRRGRPRKQP